MEWEALVFGIIHPIDIRQRLRNQYKPTNAAPDDGYHRPAAKIDIFPTFFFSLLRRFSVTIFSPTLFIGFSVELYYFYCCLNIGNKSEKKKCHNNRLQLNELFSERHTSPFAHAHLFDVLYTRRGATYGGGYLPKVHTK